MFNILCSFSYSLPLTTYNYYLTYTSALGIASITTVCVPSAKLPVAEHIAKVIAIEDVTTFFFDTVFTPFFTIFQFNIYTSLSLFLYVIFIYIFSLVLIKKAPLIRECLLFIKNYKLTYYINYLI